MTEKEEEKRIEEPDRGGIIGVTRNSQGDFVFLPIIKEDLDKSKSERITGQFIEEEDYSKITPDFLGFVGGAFKPEDFYKDGVKLTTPEAIKKAFTREIKEERKIDIDQVKVGDSFSSLGVTEQYRKKKYESFVTWIFPNITLEDEQIVAIKGAVVVPLAEAETFLENNEDKIRPIAKEAVRKILAEELTQS